MSQFTIAILALGANQPFEGMPPKETLIRAMNAFPAAGLARPKMSQLYVTPCFPSGAGPDYVNAAALLQVEENVTAKGLLSRLHEIEAMFGRQRLQRWGMRTLDIDLLAFGNAILPDQATHTEWRNLDPASQINRTPDQLILPHPRLQDRAFVLLPLAEIAPHWRHPLLNKSVMEMLAEIPADDLAEIHPL